MSHLTDAGAEQNRISPQAGLSARSIRARWAAGTFVPSEALDLPEGAEVEIILRPVEAEATGAQTGLGRRRWRWLSFGRRRPRSLLGRRWPWLLFPQRRPWLLFGLSLLVYAACRLWGLDRFPIYFFADEAFHPVRAAELAQHGLRSAGGQLLPIYFEAAAQRWTPAFALYVHLLPVVLFGKTVVVTRATTALVSLLAALAVARLLARPFGARYWWSGVLLLGSMPAWLLHSRTGFETAMMTSFFAGFLYFYLRYRLDRPAYLFPAIILAAMTFYTYSNGQIVMGAAALLLALADWRYHLRQRRVLAVGAVLALVLAWPLVSFQLGHRDALGGHLRMIGSYWYKRDMPAQQKVLEYGRRYAWGLSPQYWFVSHDKAAELRPQAGGPTRSLRALTARMLAPTERPLDLERHRYRGLGHVGWWLAPFWVIGLAICLWRHRSPAHRAVVLAALAAPAGAALAEIGITRVLAFVVPVAIMAGLGLDWLLVRCERWLAPGWLAGGTFVLLAGSNVLLIHNALTRAPFWYSDYGLYGMQYGAIQLYQEVIPEVLRSQPETTILMSSQWANGADTFPSFFLDPELRPRVQHRGVDEIMLRPADLQPNMLWVLTPGEYTSAVGSGKFKPFSPERTVPYPNGKPGFYFVRLAYSEQAPALFAAERRQRAQLVTETAMVDGQEIVVRHSATDMGRAQDLFDGEPYTLLRGMEANPFAIELEFPRPRQLGGIAGRFSAMDLEWRLALIPAGGGRPVVYELVQPEDSGDVHAELAFDRGPDLVSRMRMTIRNRKLGDFANVHVRELEFR